MEKLYETIRQMDEKKFVRMQCLFGILAGILCWAVLRASSWVEDQLLQWILLAAAVAILLVTNNIAKHAGRKMLKFKMWLCISLGACIVAFAACFLITGALEGVQRGLIELIFNLPVQAT